MALMVAEVLVVIEIYQMWPMSEILKGPGSALYGRSEPGGTVNIVTKKLSIKPVVI